jgi:hypothetical protein
MKTLIIHYGGFITGLRNYPIYPEEGESAHEYFDPETNHLIFGDLKLFAVGVTSAWSDGENIVISLDEGRLHAETPERLQGYIDAGFDFLVASIRGHNEVPSDECWQERLKTWEVSPGRGYVLAPLCGKRTAWLSSYSGNQNIPQVAPALWMLEAILNNEHGPARDCGIVSKQYELYQTLGWVGSKHSKE